MNVNDFSALDAWSKNPNDLYLAVDKKGNLTTETKWLDKVKDFFGLGKSSTMEKVEQTIATKISRTANFELTSERKEICKKFLAKVNSYHGKEQHPKTADTDMLMKNLQSKIAICEAREKLQKTPEDTEVQKALVIALYQDGRKTEASKIAADYKIEKDPEIQKEKAKNIAHVSFGRFKPYSVTPPQA